jgi:hypothetical protein
MKDINQVYFRMQAKRQRKNELAKMIKDDLAQNGDYQELLEELKLLKEKKKSIENQVKAQCLTEVAELDSLKLQISNDSELLSDIALTMYTNQETVEILDEATGSRLTPVFSVRFKKAAMSAAEVAEREAQIKELNRQLAGAV